MIFCCSSVVFEATTFQYYVCNVSVLGIQISFPRPVTDQMKWCGFYCVCIHLLWLIDMSHKKICSYAMWFVASNMLVCTSASVYEIKSYIQI
jgi:hypothetical protein